MHREALDELLPEPLDNVRERENTQRGTMETLLDNANGGA